jgi:LytS/YehU family sensor histidine kinase
VFLSNIAIALSAHASVTSFIQILDNKVPYWWLKYIIIIFFTYLLLRFCQFILGIFHLSYADMVQNDLSNNRNWYMAIPAIVSSLYFLYWQRNRQITRKISEQEYQLLNLEKLKTTAELGALQARINPHFLYNALNSIASLVHSDPDKAEEMTILLSKLFRYTTDRNNEHFSSIADELEIVKTYLSIEQVRFGDRLKFTTELQKELEDFQIPRLLLQPIVENAIKHGISKVSGDGKIEVKIQEKQDKILLSVHDSGPLFPEEMASGYGLRSIQDKLRLIYGNDANLEIQNDEKYKAVLIKIKKR